MPEYSFDPKLQDVSYCQT